MIIFRGEWNSYQFHVYYVLSLHTHTAVQSVLCTNTNLNNLHNCRARGDLSDHLYKLFILRMLNWNSKKKEAQKKFETSSKLQSVLKATAKNPCHLFLNMSLSFQFGFEIVESHKTLFIIIHQPPVQMSQHSNLLTGSIQLKSGVTRSYLRLTG